MPRLSPALLALTLTLVLALAVAKALCYGSPMKIMKMHVQSEFVVREAMLIQLTEPLDIQRNEVANIYNDFNQNTI